MLNRRIILVLSSLSSVLASSYGYADEPERLRFGGYYGGLETSFSGPGSDNFDDVEARRSYSFLSAEAAFYRHDVWRALDLSIHVGGSYARKGPLGTFNGEDLAYAYKYIEFPLSARLTIPLYRKFAAYGAVGVTSGILLSAKINDRDIIENSERFDLGFTYAAGVNIPTLWSDWSIDIEYRRNHGYLNIDKNSPDSDATMHETRYVLLGLMYQRVRRDSDGDRVPDKEEARKDCILVPEDRDGFEDNDGCPDHDNDNDGILDRQDECKGTDTDYLTTREDRDDFRDGDGCPDTDNDEDGIDDDGDGPNGMCKDQAEDKDGFEDEDGCPDTDNDGDGINDEMDGRGGACKDQAEDKDGFKDEDGCPDPDNDKDGLLDEADQCPNTPEIKNGWQDSDGCPEVIPWLIRQAELGDAKFSSKGSLNERNAAQSLVALLDEHKLVLFAAKETFELMVAVYSTEQSQVDSNVEAARRVILGGLARRISRQARVGADNKPGKEWWAEQKELIGVRVVFTGCLAPPVKATPLGRSRIEVRLRRPGVQEDVCTHPPSLPRQLDALSGVVLAGKNHFLQTGALRRSRRGQLSNKTKQQFMPLVQIMSVYSRFGATVIAYASTKDIAEQTARGLIGDLEAVGVPAQRLHTGPANWCMADRPRHRIELLITRDGERAVEVSCDQSPSQRKARLGALALRGMFVDSSGFTSKGTLQASSRDYRSRLSNLNAELERNAELSVSLVSFAPAKSGVEQAQANADAIRRGVTRRLRNRVKTVSCVGALRVELWPSSGEAAPADLCTMPPYMRSAQPSDAREPAL